MGNSSSRRSSVNAVDQATGMTFESLYQQAQEMAKAHKEQILELLLQLEAADRDRDQAHLEQERLEGSLETANEMVRFVQAENQVLTQAMEEQKAPERDELRDQLAEAVRRQVKSLTEEKRAWEAERVDWEARHDRTMEQLVDATEQVAELKEEHQAYREQQELLLRAQAKSERSRRASLTMISSLETTLAQKEADMNNSRQSVHEERQTLEAKLKEMERTVKEQRDQLRQVSDQVDKLEAEKADYMALSEGESGAADKDNEEVQRVLQIEQALEELSAEFTALESVHQTLQEEKDKFQSAASQLQKSYDESRLLHEESKEQLAALEAVLENVKSDHSLELQQRLAELEGIKTDYAKLLADLNKKDQELEIVRNDFQSLEKVNANLLSSLESADEENDDQLHQVQSALEKLQEVNEQLRRQLESVKLDKDGELQQQQAELDGVKADYAKLLADLNKKDNELAMLRTDSQSQEKVNTKLLADLEAADAEYYEQLQKVQAALVKVQDLNVELTAQIEFVKLDKNQELQRLQVELDGVKAEYGRLLADLTGKNEELSNVQRESQSLEKVNARLLADLESADAENNEQLQNVQSSLEKLQQVNSKLTAELESKNHQLDGVKGEYGKLLADLSSKDEKLQILQSEAAALEKVNTRLLNDLESADAENGRAMQELETVLEALKVDNARMETTISEKTGKIQQLQEECEGHKSFGARLQEELDAQKTTSSRSVDHLETTASAMEGELRKRQEELEVVKGDNLRLKGDLAALKEDNVRLEGKLEALSAAMEEELKTTQGSLTSLQADNERVLEVNAQLLKANESIEEDLRTLKSEVETLDAEKANFLAAVESMTKEKERLSESIESLELSLKQSEVTVRSLTEALDSLQQSSGVNGDELKIVLAEKDALSSRALEQEALAHKKGSELEELSKELEAANNEKSSLVDDIESLQRKLREANSEKESLELSLKESGTTIDMVRDTISKLGTAGEEMAAAVEEEKQNLTDQLKAKAAAEVDSVRQQLASVEAAKNSLSEQLESVCQELHSATASKDTLEISLLESSATIESLREKVNLLESAREDMIRATKEEKQALVDAIELKAQEQLEALLTEKKAMETTTTIIRKELQQAGMIRGTAEAKLKDSEATVAKLQETISRLESTGGSLFQEERMRLEGQVVALESSLKECETALSAAKEKTEHLSSEKYFMASELAKTRATLEVNCGSLEAARATIQKLQGIIANMKASSESREGRKASWIEQRGSVNDADLGQKLSTITRAKESVEDELRVTQHRASELQVAVETMTSQLEVRKASLVVADANLREQLSTVTRAKESVENELRLTKQQVFELQETVETMTNQLEEREASVVEPGGLVVEANLSEQLSKVTRAKEAVEVELHLTQQQVSKLQETVEKRTNQLEELSTTMKRATEEKALVQAELKDGKTLINQAVLQLDAANEKLFARAKQLESLQEEKNLLVSNLTKSNEECQAAVSAKENLESELEDTTSNLIKSTEKCQAAVSEKESLEKELEISKENLMNSIEQYQVTVSLKESLENELEMTKSNLMKRNEEYHMTVLAKEKLEKQLEETKSNLMKSMDECRAAVSAKESLESELEMATSNLIKLTEDFHAAASAKEQLEKELEDMKVNLMESTKECLTAVSAKESLENELEYAKSELEMLRQAIQDTEDQKASAMHNEGGGIASRQMQAPEDESESALSETTHVSDAKMAMQERVKELEEALEQAEAKLEQAQDRLSAVVSESYILEANADDARHQCRVSLTEKEALEAKLAEVSSERDNLQADVEGMTATIEELENLVTKKGKKSQPKLLLEANEVLMKKVQSLEGALAESEQQLEAANDRLDALVRESYELEAHVDNARYERRATMTRNEELEAKLVEVETTANDLRGQVEMLMGGKTREVEVLMGAKATEVEVTMKESAPAAFMEANTALEEKVVQLQGDLFKSEEKRQELQEKLDAVMKASGDASISEHGALLENQQLRARLIDAEAEVEDLRRQVEELLSRSNELDSIADEEDAILREELETIHTWNSALEANNEKSSKELEAARAELEAVKSLIETMEHAQSSPQVASRSIPSNTDVPDEPFIDFLPKARLVVTGEVDRNDEELENVGSDEARLLKEQLDTVNAWNLALESNLERANKELKEALSSRLSSQQGQTCNEGLSNSVPDKNVLIESLQSEKRALTVKVDQQEDLLAETNCRVAELEACLEEYVSKSLELKMRLARKSVMIVELEQELKGQTSGQSSQSRELGSIANGYDTFPPLENPGLANTNQDKIGPEEEVLCKEKSALTAKVDQLEEALLDSNCRVSELEACLEEYAGKSANLKMRLAKKTALISEFEEELKEPSSSYSSQQRQLKFTGGNDVVDSLEGRGSVNGDDQHENLSIAKQELPRKLNQPEESSVKPDCGVSELEAEVEEPRVIEDTEAEDIPGLKEELLKAKATIVRMGAKLPNCEALDEEIRALTDELSKAEAIIKEQAKMIDDLGDCVCDKSNTIEALEARIGEQMEKSSEIKLRLARKSSTIADLEDQIAQASGPRQASENGFNSFADAFASSNASTVDELEKENELLSVKVARSEASLKKEKATIQSQKLVIEELEDTVEESKIRISELEVCLEEQIGISANLKLRLARRTATISDLQESLDVSSGRQNVHSALDGEPDKLALRLLEGTILAPPSDVEEPEPMNYYSTLNSQGLSSFGETRVSPEEESKEGEETFASRKEQRPSPSPSPSQQLQACMEDAKANEALFEQIVSLVDFAEKKKKRLHAMNERLEIAVSRSRAIRGSRASTSSPEGESKSGAASRYGLAEDQAALNKTVQDLERQWKETRNQLDSVHQTNVKLEAALDHISKERESALAARAVLESSLREAQEEVHSLRVAVEAMEAGRGHTPRTAVEQEVSEHRDMDPERTTIPVDEMDAEVALQRRTRACRDFLARANQQLAQMEVAVSHERQELENTIAICERVLSILGLPSFREIRLLDVVMDKVLHLGVSSVPVMPV